MPVPVKVGLCGFTVGAAQYFETFPVVEVQQTFYEPPTALTLARWRAQAPAAFEFTLKAWQLVTHRATSSTYRRLKTKLTAAQREECGAFAPTETVMMGWERTVACARALRATAILFQCPASFRALPENVANMRRFFSAITRPANVRLLFEPRGPWPDTLVRELCEELGLLHAADPFVRASVTPKVTYWRLHGIGSAYHAYSDGELATLVGRLPEGGEAYVMFNNIPRPADARRFTALLRAKGPRAVL